jgi:RNA polymerase sigma-70 factor (ECF subfamily)
VTPEKNIESAPGEPDPSDAAFLKEYMPPASRLHLALAPPLDAEEQGPVRFEALFQRYSRHVAGVAARLLGTVDAEVDDVVQDVFWLASRRLERLPDMMQARGWLTTVTTRIVRRRLLRRRYRALFHGDGSDGSAANVPAPGATAEQRALLARLYEVLDRLPLEQRLAWSLRYLEGEPLEAVASACGCSLATAKRRIGAAKEIIEEVFGDA